MQYIRNWGAAAFVVVSALNFTHVNAIEFEHQQFSGDVKNAEIVTHLDRKALKFSGGRLWLDDVELSNGVVEFEVAMAASHTFIGTNVRVKSETHYEDFYLRAHLDNKPDALQYQPVVNGTSGWQIFSDENAISAADLHFDRWNKVKVVVIDDKAEFYVNSEQPVLHIPDLKNDIAKGKVALWMFSIDKQPAYFSNINVRKLQQGEGLVAQPKAGKPLPAGLIDNWLVSEPVAETEVSKNNRLNINTENLQWQSLTVEHNGIANLAKRASLSKDADTALIKLSLETDRSVVRKLKFGFSDRVQIFLNGDLLYAGNDGWKTRDYRFLGTVGWHDAVGLPLKPGHNEVIVAVSESFGGWAWTAAWDD